MEWNQQATQPDMISHPVRLVGGAAIITIDADGGGYGITVTRSGTGLYKLTWSQNPGVFQGWSAAIGAATPANVAGHTIVRGTYDPATLSLYFTLYNATPAPHDLAAAEYIDIVVDFKG